MWCTFNVVLLQPFPGTRKFYFNGLTVFCVFAYVADSDLKAWTLLQQIYFVANFLSGKEHLHSKSSLVTLQTWVNTAKQVLRDMRYAKTMNSPQWYLWPFVFIFRKHVSIFLAKMPAENKKSHEYLYKGSRLGTFIRAFWNLQFPFFSHLITDHKY